MSDRDIVVYGTGINGEKFFCNYKEKYKIVFCVDEIGNRKFHGLQVYSLSDVIGKLKDYFVVVATNKIEYNKIKSRLDTNLIEYKDFIHIDDFGKKIAILYGNCHMDVLEKYLMNNPYFYSQYTIKRKLVNLLSKNIPADEELAVCDLLLCQDIRGENELGIPSAEELIKKVPSWCTSIKIVNLHGFNLLFPQMNKNLNKLVSGRDSYLYKHINRNAIDISVNCVKDTQILLSVEEICTLDYRIEYLSSLGFSMEKIVEEVLDGNPYSKEEIINNFYSELERIKEREKQCDVKISDYIENNYMNMQLFYDPKHPTENLIAEKGRRVLQLLHIDCYEMNPLPKMINSRENFIYGCVKRALGIKYDIKFIRFGCNSSLSNKAIDLKTFVKDYITWFDGSDYKISLEYDNVIGYGVGWYYEVNKYNISKKIKFDYLCDKKLKEGSKYDGIEIISTDKIRNLSNVCVIIFTGNIQNYLSIMNICKDMQVDYIHASLLLE